MPDTSLRSRVSSAHRLFPQAPLSQPDALKVARTQADQPCANDVQLGLGLREFRAFLQPKFDLRSGQVKAVEILARWQHPLRGVLGPENFIPLMESRQWLDELLFEMLEQGLAYQLKLHHQGRLLGLAFNLSQSQLSSSTLVDRLEERLREHPLPPSAITFEVTEDGPADLCATTVKQLKRLSRLGIRLSLDDFGTGSSSLWRLCQVPFNEIKLAGEFTRLLDGTAHYPAIIRSTVALADDLGTQLVVEGIETEQQRRRLLAMGVRIGQGFLCASPMSIEAFDRWISTPYRQSRPRSVF